MPLVNLFFSFHGRVSRGDFWYAILLALSVFVVAGILIESLFGRSLLWLLHVPL